MRNYKDLVITFLSKGPEAVTEAVQAGMVTGIVAARALTHLRKSDPSKVDALQQAITDGGLLPPGSKDRGRSAPVVGECRKYSAQQLSGGDAFIRLPLGALGVKKGAKVSVSFEDGRLVVTR